MPPVASASADASADLPLAVLPPMTMTAAPIAPALTRRKRLLVSDMDSTIITIECIDELADFAGLKAEIAAVTRRAMNGELAFAEALEARVALLAGVRESAVAEVIRERLRLMPGAAT